MGAPARRAGPGAAFAVGDLARRAETERTFLALCIASPAEGERALAELDPEEHFTSERLRRAARSVAARGAAGLGIVPP